MRNTYKHGDYLAICDRCGFEWYASQLAKEWTGLMVCRGAGTNDCWEARHPQELVKGRKDRQSPPWTRSEPPDVFIDAYVWNDTTKAWEAS